MKRISITVSAVMILGSFALAQSNIDNTIPNQDAWGENVGWTTRKSK